MAIDAIDVSNKRRAVNSRVQSVDVEITDSKRRQLISTGRDAARNFSLAAWAIRKHLDFVSGFNFHAATGDPDLDERISGLMEWYGRPQNCDVAGRHSLGRMIRLAEAGRTVDGDCALLKLRDGRLQAIEGDRIRTPSEHRPRTPSSDGWPKVLNGIEVDRRGKARRFAVHSRGDRMGSMEFDRWVMARNILHHGYFDRFDQVRGVSPLVSALATLVDVYESFDYALAKAKVAQLFGITFYRDAMHSIGQGGLTEGAAEGDDSAESTYDVNFGTRPLVLDLEPGDRAEFLENKTPSGEFQAFTHQMISLCMASLDLPYNFYDASHTNFFGSKAAMQLYLKACESKRADVRDLLRRITTWRIGLFIDDGWLELPPGWRISDLKFEWIATGVPWFDPTKEISADVAAINAGLRTRQEIRRERYGDDWFKVVNQLAVEEKHMADAGISVNMAPPVATEAGEPEIEPGKDEPDEIE